MASLLSATMNGLVITALFHARHSDAPHSGAPVRSGRNGRMVPSGHGIASIAAAFLESGPTIEWNDERLSMIRQTLETEGGPGT
jgi:hypothetical protein